MKKGIFSLLTVCFILAVISQGCSDKPDPVFRTVDNAPDPNTAFSTPEDLFASLAPSPISKTINAQTGGSVVGTQGISVNIPADAFVDQSGNPVTGDVNLEFMEVVDIGDMILTGATTGSGNQLLASAGMFNLEANQQGNPVNLNPSSFLQVNWQTPNAGDDGMELFVGNRDTENDNVNWQRDNRGQGGADSIGYFGFINFLGWCNLDRFYNEYTDFTSNFTVTLPRDGSDTSEKFSVHLIVEEGVVTLFNEGQGVYSSGAYEIGIGMKVRVLAVCIKNKVLSYHLTDEFTITDNQEVDVTELTVIEEEGLKTLLKGL